MREHLCFGGKSSHPTKYYSLLVCRVCEARWEVEKERDLGQDYLVRDWEAQCPDCKAWHTED